MLNTLFTAPSDTDQNKNRSSHANRFDDDNELGLASKSLTIFFPEASQKGSSYLMQKLNVDLVAV